MKIERETKIHMLNHWALCGEQISGGIKKRKRMVCVRWKGADLKRWRQERVD